MLNELDKNLIMELQEDGRKSLSELSKKLGVSISTVGRRLNYLVESGTITITAIPNPVKVGYLTAALIAYSIEKKRLDSTIQEICNFSCNHLVGTTTGPYDLLSWSLFENNQELSRYLTNQTTNIKGLKDTDTSLILEFKKRTFGWISD